MLSYYVSGNPESPLVILAHGVTDCALAWADYIEHLAARYCVVAVDLLGHGFSPRYSAEQLADPFEAGLRELELTVEFVESTVRPVPEPKLGSAAASGMARPRKAVLIGHSMGGAMVTQLAARRPELCAGVIVEDPAWLSADQRLRFLETAPENTEKLRDWARDPAAAISENAGKRPAWPAEDHLGWALGKNRCDPAVVASGVVSFTQPWQEVVRAVSVPLLVVSSDRLEDLVGVQGLREVSALGNPAVRTAFIPDCEHTLRRSAISAFNAIVDPYLAQWAVPVESGTSSR